MVRDDLEDGRGAGMDLLAEPQCTSCSGWQDGALIISSCHGKMLVKKGTSIFCHGRVGWLEAVDECLVFSLL